MGASVTEQPIFHPGRRVDSVPQRWRRARLNDLDSMGGDGFAPGIQDRIKDLWTEPEMHLLGRTLVHEGRPIAVVGISMYWEGVAYAWAFVSPEVGKHRKSFIRGTKDLIHWAMDAFKLHRLQATCVTDPPLFYRTLEVLGFEREGLMRRYGLDGSDHYLYAFVRP